MIQDVLLFLKEHYPFSELPESSLEALSHYITIKYLPEGEVVFKEGDPPLEHLYLIRKGLISLKVGDREIDSLHEGDCFGYTSLLSKESPTTSAIVEEEAILYLIPKEVFLNLVRKYESFESFFTKSLAEKLSSTASMLRLSQRNYSLESFFTLKVKELRIRRIPTLPPEASVLEAAKLFRDKNLSCVFVGRQTPEGIITERDIIKKVVAPSREPSRTTLQDIASFPIISVDAEDFVFEALLSMASNNVRRVGVKEKDKLIGVLEDRDIIAYESKNLIVIIKEIEKAQSLEELRYLYSISQDTVYQLFQSGVGVERIGRLISEINDKIMARAVFLTIREVGQEPPLNFSILVLGSEGRREQTLKTDQDNALIYDDSLPMLDIEPKDYFSKFANTYTEILLSIGFPPCPGKVMVNNPQWRKGASEWKNTLREWISKPEPENTLRLGMFFDFL
jgi:CBS domain-containing protein